MQATTSKILTHNSAVAFLPILEQHNLAALSSLQQVKHNLVSREHNPSLPSLEHNNNHEVCQCLVVGD